MLFDLLRDVGFCKRLLGGFVDLFQREVLLFGEAAAGFEFGGEAGRLAGDAAELAFDFSPGGGDRVRGAVEFVAADRPAANAERGGFQRKRIFSTLGTSVAGQITLRITPGRFFFIWMAVV